MKSLLASLITSAVLSLSAFAAPVNVNTATAKELESVKGIGATLAARIVAARPYAKLDELQRVKGIGPKRLAAIRPALYVECTTDTDCENRNGAR